MADQTNFIKSNRMKRLYLAIMFLTIGAGMMLAISTNSIEKSGIPYDASWQQLLEKSIPDVQNACVQYVEKYQSRYMNSNGEAITRNELLKWKFTPVMTYSLPKEALKDAMENANIGGKLVLEKNKAKYFISSKKKLIYCVGLKYSDGQWIVNNLNKCEDKGVFKTVNKSSFYFNLIATGSNDISKEFTICTHKKGYFYSINGDGKIVDFASTLKKFEASAKAQRLIQL